uniref:Uncharacterized protein n=1 Tax=Nelumbo nucifera TaxID=4432 RepID=A0A822ZS94_NELNU|nr:TPA_asm: hypothetical protein HUJ06_017297 [Nelumbo nucifera]
MDNLSNSDKHHGLGYHPSPSSGDRLDRSITETTGYSTLSGDSFRNCRTNSETSSFSEPADDNSCSDEPSPLRWPITKPVTSHHDDFTSLGMKQDIKVVDETNNDEVVINSGELIHFLPFLDKILVPIVRYKLNAVPNKLKFLSRTRNDEGKIF